MKAKTLASSNRRSLSLPPQSREARTKSLVGYAVLAVSDAKNQHHFELPLSLNGGVSIRYTVGIVLLTSRPFSINLGT